ncbi:MAG: HlyD family type I secretion periplasmic adaptor subunit [Pseudomonadota bacterium]
MGRRFVFWFVGGAVVLSALISISGAVVATGAVTVESSYQLVQHPTGGVVKSILVGSGDYVREGQRLLELEPTQAKADVGVLASRVADLAIQKARLVAERDDVAEFELPADLDSGQPAIKQAFAAQQALFRARRRTRLGEASVLDQRTRQLEGELRSLRAQRNARQRERAINADELATVLPLFERGYVSRQRLAPLQREQARLEGDIGRLDAEISKIESASAETDLRKQQAEKEFLNSVTSDLSRVTASLEQASLERDKLADILARTTITAPRSGFVHDLSARTVGGVIQPGAAIAQIIPDGDTLIIEAQVPANEIDRLYAGQPAHVTFPAFNARTTPRLEGKLATISPAELRDERGRATYKARIRIPPTELARIGSEHRLIPGMPADVFIETSSRSILSYVLKPLSDAMGRAFRER